MDNELQQRVTALEEKFEQLHEAYRDVAYEYQNNLIQRIEDIRADVTKSLQAIEGYTDDQVVKARQELDAVIEKAKKSLSHDALVASLAEHKKEILSSLIDPSTGRLRHR